jgi:hypothetical protein
VDQTAQDIHAFPPLPQFVLRRSFETGALPVVRRERGTRATANVASSS